MYCNFSVSKKQKINISTHVKQEISDTPVVKEISAAESAESK
jgi:hypothetical protein